MTATLNARCSGLWLTADGTPVTILERQGRAAVVELGAPAAGYKAGRTVTLPAAWVTDDAPPALPAATVEVDAAPAAIAAPLEDPPSHMCCPTCGRPW